MRNMGERLAYPMVEKKRKSGYTKSDTNLVPCNQGAFSARLPRGSPYLTLERQRAIAVSPYRLLSEELAHQE